MSVPRDPAPDATAPPPPDDGTAEGLATDDPSRPSTVDGGNGGPPAPRPVPLATPRPSRTRRRLRLKQLIVGLVVVPLLLAVGAGLTLREFLGTEYLTARVTAALEDRFAVGFEVGSVSYSFPDLVTVEGLVLASPPGSRFAQLVEIPRMRGRLRLLSLLSGRVEMQSLRVDGAHVYIERDGDGVCTLKHAVDTTPAPVTPESADERPGLGWTPPSVILRNVQVHCCPVSVFQTERPLSIPSLVLRYDDEERRSFRLSGRAADPAVEGIELTGIELTGSGDFATGDLDATLTIEDLALDDSLGERLPESLRQVWDEYRPRGIADLDHRLVLEAGVVTENRARIALVDVGIEMTSPPVNLEGVRGAIEVTPHSVEVIDPLVGRAFSGRAELQGAIALLPDGPGGGHVELELTSFLLDDRVRSALPDAVAREWDLYSPRGIADARISARGETFPPEVGDTFIDLRGVDITYRDYPYPLHGLSGTISIVDRAISIEVNGPSDQRPLARIDARAEIAPDRPMQIQVRLGELPLDDELRRALPDEIGEVYDEYDPGGVADLTVLVLRDAPGEPQRVEVHLDPKGASLAHEVFPLRVTDVTGSLVFFEERAELRDLRGRHGESLVRLDIGEVGYDGEHPTELSIVAPELVVTPEVLAALPPESREVAASFGIDRLERNGKLATTVDLIAPPGGDLEFEVIAEVIDPVTIRYEDFPLPLVFHTGRFLYRSSEELITIEQVATAPEISPVVRVNGYHTRPDPADEERRFLSVQIDVEPVGDGPGLDIADPDLVASLPADLKLFADRMSLEGSVAGTVHVTHDIGGPAGEIARYDAEIELSDGSLDFGLKLFDMQSRFEVQGGYAEDEPHHFTGVFQEGSYRFTRFKIDVPQALEFCYGEVHPLIQMRERLAVGQKGYLPSQHFVEALTEGDVKQVFQAALGPAKLFEGDLNGFFYVDLADGGDFGGEAEATDVDLSVGSEDIFRTPDTEGLATGTVQVRGKTDDVTTMTGFGDVRVRDAKLSRIPALAAVILNPLKGFSADNQRFDEANARYRIGDERFIIDTMGDLVLESPVVNIHGKGWLDFENEIDLLLEPQTLGGLPILSDIVNSLTRFRLKGNLDDPEIFGDTP